VRRVPLPSCFHLLTINRHPVPDLAFSELNFLNAPRPSPPSPASSSSLDDDLPPPTDLLKSKLPRTYGSKSKTRRSSSKHFPVNEDEESEEAAPAREDPPPPSKKKEKIATVVPPPKKRQRLVFSGVEIPVRRSSSSSSLTRPRSLLVPPLRSPSKPVSKSLRAVEQVSASASASTTNDSALSAASLARRRRVSLPTTRAPLPDLPLDNLPSPTLHRQSISPRGAQTASYGGGFDNSFDAQTVQASQEQAEQPPSPSLFGTASLQRFIDDALSPQPRPQHAGTEIESDSALNAEQSIVGEQSSFVEDGFIHLRPQFAVESPNEVGSPLLLDPNPAAYAGLGRHGATNDILDGEASHTPSQAVGDGVWGEDAPTVFSVPLSAAFVDSASFDGDLVDCNDGHFFATPNSQNPPACDETAATVFSLPPSARLSTLDNSSAFAAPSAHHPFSPVVPSSVAAFDASNSDSADDLVGERKSGFLRSTGNGGVDLADDAVYKEAMKRQWPKNIC
jgi:hypothetical protein